MLTKQEFWALCEPAVERRAATWGFRAEHRGIFVRPLPDIWHGFAVIPTRHGPDAFYVEVGVHVPILRERARHLDATDTIGFEVSHRLGTYREGGRLIGLDEWYTCGDAKQLQHEIERMFGHFEAWALPWYDRFSGLSDVAREFYKLRLDDPPEKQSLGAGCRAPDPFGWAMYGWMLEAIGRCDEAKSWLHRAYVELSRPACVENGRLVASSGNRVTRVPRAEEEEQLLVLLRQSLGGPS